jgi:putative ABC transport system permease protein
MDKFLMNKLHRSLRAICIRPILLPLFFDSWANIISQKQRAGLALLGIIIGVASVVAMISLGHMAEREMLRQFESMGVNMFVVLAGSGEQSMNGALGGTTSAGTRVLRIETIRSLPADVPAVVTITPLVSGTVMARLGVKSDVVGIAGVMPEFKELTGLRLEDGRFPSNFDKDNFVAVIGSHAASKLTGKDSHSAVGLNIKIGSYFYRIVGQLNPTTVNSYIPIDLNNSVIVPIGIVDRVMGSNSLNAAIGRMVPGTDSVGLASAVKAHFEQAQPKQTIEVQSARDLIQTLKSQRAIQNQVLVGIGSVSLIVGGIGIMNVMLMNVLERRREIGLRKAIGATPLDIQISFLVESLMLSSLGGVLGCGFGLIFSFLFAVKVGWEFSILWYAVPLSIFISSVVGVLFGTYPAMSASKLDPIMALRTD